MNETDIYRQQIMNQLLVAEQKPADDNADVSEHRNTDKPGGKQQRCIDEIDDPIAQVLKNKLQVERQEEDAMNVIRNKLTKDIRMDIVEHLIG